MTKKRSARKRFIVGFSIEAWRGKTTIYDCRRDGFIYRSKRRGQPVARAYNENQARRVANALNRSLA